jgi:Flp pilus assembly protein TadB
MLEVVMAVTAGLCVTAAVLAVAAPTPELHVPRKLTGWWAGDKRLVHEAGLSWLGPRILLVLEVSAAFTGAVGAAALTRFPVLAVPGAAGGLYILREAIARRARMRQTLRQDAVIEAVRMMRQLLETGATSVNQAVALLAERGPLPLRPEFRVIAARPLGRRQAWREARERIGEPLFDMLAAAVLIQRPGGGELVPLFADLETAVSAAQEVEREARALQAQARSASSIIVALPIAFLGILSALGSPYLDAFRQPAGQAFLLSMLAVMAAGYVWMRRMLDLPGLQRVRLGDA